MHDALRYIKDLGCPGRCKQAPNWIDLYGRMASVWQLVWTCPVAEQLNRDAACWSYL
jgi:hypothetical protein